ncbi:hypothetical protein P879_07967 [Paragonimus westermani]|uniref:Uncharacterized protein n=1 Tax=Paragonimus westermani TaxID=34504 RepID=A0A8T0DSA1_9TREM|nr:hypothetical protein P879_07967 [Paragonimus westermani]
MNERANMLVAELLDTELIGEGCLSTYRHAAECLLTDDATLVPYAADLFVQVSGTPRRVILMSMPIRQYVGTMEFN